MSDPTVHVTLDQWVEQAGDRLREHDFMIRALAAEVERLRKLVPDTERVEEGSPGETRGNSTAFRLPDGWGSLVVTTTPDGRGILKYQNGRHKERVEIDLVQNR